MWRGNPSAWSKCPSNEKKKWNLLLQHKSFKNLVIKPLILALLSWSSMQTRFPNDWTSAVNIRLLCKSSAATMMPHVTDSGLFSQNRKHSLTQTSISGNFGSICTTSNESRPLKVKHWWKLSDPIQLHGMAVCFPVDWSPVYISQIPFSTPILMI